MGNRGNDAANKAADKLRPVTQEDRKLSAQLAEVRASESVGHRTERPHHPDGWQLGGRSEG